MIRILAPIGWILTHIAPMAGTDLVAYIANRDVVGIVDMAPVGTEAVDLA